MSTSTTHKKLLLSGLREDFPILQQQVRGKPLVYLDNAATTQKPSQVIEAVNHYYCADNANVHRGLHALSERATKDYEAARETIRQFINAAHTREIVFVRGTTEAINLVAQSFGAGLKAGDEILISAMEHHSNIVPWQMLAQRQGTVLRVIPITDKGEIDLPAFAEMLSDKVKLLSIAHVSNALGTINPVKAMIQMAHEKNIPVLLDGAQGAPHETVDVQALDCDFYTISSHKMYGPTGIGALYGKAELLEKMPPYQGGGDMITQVSFEKTEYNQLPYKFEAGTPNIAATIGFAAAVKYLQDIGLDKVAEHEHALLSYATDRLERIAGLKIIGSAARKAAVISFILDGIHPHDIGTVLDMDGIAIRAGHHCAMPLMTRMNVPATARASFAIYNTYEEVDALVAGIEKVKRLFQK